EVFEIHLVHDAGIRRHHTKVPERVLAPPQKRVPLLVARELELGVQLKGVRLIEVVDLDRMIDHELDRLQRVHLRRVAAQSHDAATHRSKVDHARYAGEILKEDAGRRERNLLHGVALHIPARERLDVDGFHEASVFVPQQIFEEDFQRERQPGDAREAFRDESRKTEVVRLLASIRKARTRSKAVNARHWSSWKTS